MIKIFQCYANGQQAYRNANFIKIDVRGFVRQQPENIPVREIELSADRNWQIAEMTVKCLKRGYRWPLCKASNGLGVEERHNRPPPPSLFGSF